MKRQVPDCKTMWAESTSYWTSYTDSLEVLKTSVLKLSSSKAGLLPFPFKFSGNDVAPVHFLSGALWWSIIKHILASNLMAFKDLLTG